MIGIYKITNILNGKSYIGKSVNILNRWRQHRSLVNTMPIDLAIHKYGKENFNFEVLEECKKEELNEKEIKWISYFNTYLGDGYNCTAGGDGASHKVKLSEKDIDDIIMLLQKNMPIKQIAQQYSVSCKTISDINIGKSRIRQNITYPIKTNSSCLNIDKIIDMLFETDCDYEEVGKMLGISGMTVRSFCKKYDIHTKEKYCKKFNIPYVDDQSYHSKTICQYDLNNQLLKQYTSIREASRQTGINHHSIYKAIHTDNHYAKGYKWFLYEKT